MTSERHQMLAGLDPRNFAAPIRQILAGIAAHAIGAPIARVLTQFGSKLVVKIHRAKIEATCLNRDGQFYSLFCRGDQCCPAWESGDFGAADDPSGAYANDDD